MPKLILKFDEAFDQMLSSLANGGSKADVILKAVSTYEYLKSEVSKENSKRRIAIVDGDGKEQEEVILP